MKEFQSWGGPREWKICLRGTGESERGREGTARPLSRRYGRAVGTGRVEAWRLANW